MTSTEATTVVTKTMKAVVWEGDPYHVTVKEVPRPSIGAPGDVVVRVSVAGICGSLVDIDLHIYHGLGGGTAPSWHVGHEAVGIVVEVGSEVTTMKKGQRVIVPDFCYLDATTTGVTKIGFYGEGNLPGLQYLGGAQAEYVRIPNADANARLIPEGPQKDEEWVLLSDIFPTAWEGLTFSGFQPGDTVSVFGCGPVGLLVQYSAFLRGASKVYAIDHVESRLAKAKSIGSIPINIKAGEASTQILKLEPNGVQRTVDACGYECVNGKLQPQENYILDNAVLMTAVNGGIGVIGIYYGGDPSPGSPDLTPARGFVNFNIGQFLFKNLSMKAGAVDPHPIVPTLMELILSGRADPSFVIDRVVDNIDEAPDAYKDFSAHKYGKTVIKFPAPK